MSVGIYHSINIVLLGENVIGPCVALDRLFLQLLTLRRQGMVHAGIPAGTLPLCSSEKKPTTS